MPTKKKRITFAISDDEFSQLEEYRYKYRLKNQSQAIIKLVEIGLEDALKELEQKETAPAPPPLSKEAQELLPKFEQLEQPDKYRIIGQVEGLLMQEKYAAKEKTPSAG